jgi:hypothetical protein
MAMTADAITMAATRLAEGLNAITNLEVRTLNSSSALTGLALDLGTTSWEVSGTNKVRLKIASNPLPHTFTVGDGIIIKGIQVYDDGGVNDGAPADADAIYFTLTNTASITFPDGGQYILQTLECTLSS